DNFGTNAYTNNDGSQNFAAAWIESNDLGGAGATTGDVQVVGGELQLGNQGDAAPFTNQPSVERQLDLSAYAAAVLTFDWRTASGVDRIGNTTDIGDSIVVEASSDGGTTYEILDEFAGIVGVASGSTAYDITPYIASNTRIRLRISNRYAGPSEQFFVDNFSINASTTADGGSPDAGHWTLEVDLSGDVNGRPAGFGAGIRQDDVNAFGLRAHDGTAGAGGTEYNLYADSFVIVGVNDNDRGRDYDLFPYVTSGCDADVHDFDFDANQPNPPAPNTNTQPFGSLTLTSRSASFVRNNTTMSNNDAWNSENTGTTWVSADTADDYGIWSMDVRIEDWTDNNYGPVYMTNFQAAAAPPTANPETNAFRIYFPNDSGTAPAKPYLSQYLTYVIDQSSGGNPPTVGQTSRYAVSVLVTNPSGSIGDITFSASNVVTSHIPVGTDTTYEGVAFVTAGTVLSQPVIGASTGDVTWNPGTLSPGESETLVYFVDVSPAVVGNITVTGTAGSGDGTRAVWLDETGAQTFSFGELCELAVVTSPATPVLVSSFGATWIDGRVVVDWSTAAEAETVSFDLYRRIGEEVVEVSERPLPAQIGRSQGGVYRLVDSSAPAEAEELTYWLAERETTGRQRFHGPYRVSPKPDAGAVDLPEGGFESAPHLDPTAEARAEHRATAAGSHRAGASGLRRSWGPPASVVGDLALRVKVGESGLYRITATELSTVLEIPEAAARRLLTRQHLRLETGGQEVAWRKVGRGEALEFYGQALDTP
ncbi:MAG: hypothetical protein MI919_11495, partial [Holophagales bacterium]|nr:hypothetical protein [Holophagales bacterium]